MNKGKPEKRKTQAKQKQAPHMNASTASIRECWKTKGEQAKITQKRTKDKKTQ